MSARVVQWIIVEVTCDGPGCSASFEAQTTHSGSNTPRARAGGAGWRVRPARGTGMRSAPDLCPACRDDILAGGR